MQPICIDMQSSIVLLPALVYQCVWRYNKGGVVSRASYSGQKNFCILKVGDSLREDYTFLDIFHHIFLVGYFYKYFAT